MGVELTNYGEVLVANLKGDIDHHTAKQIRETVDTEVESRKPALLKLDFKGVEFMDSSGIGLIMGRYKLMRAIDSKLQVVNVPKYLSRVIKMSGLDRLGILESQKGENYK